MRSSHFLAGVTAVLAIAACAVSQPSGSRSWNGSSAHDLSAPSADSNDDDGDGDEGDEVRIGASEIPESIRAAAIAALPGLTITEAEIEEAGSVYCVHGTVDGKFREVEVTTVGAIATVEAEDDDDDD